MRCRVHVNLRLQQAKCVVAAKLRQLALQRKDLASARSFLFPYREQADDCSEQSSHYRTRSGSDCAQQTTASHFNTMRKLRAVATAPGSVMSGHLHVNIILVSVPCSRMFVADQLHIPWWQKSSGGEERQRYAFGQSITNTIFPKLSLDSIRT
jgi:hypothetical protein